MALDLAQKPKKAEFEFDNRLQVEAIRDTAVLKTETAARAVQILNTAVTGKMKEAMAENESPMLKIIESLGKKNSQYEITSVKIGYTTETTAESV